MLSVATDADFLAYFKSPPPPTWLGVAYRNGERIVGMGVVVWEEGHALGFVDQREPISTFSKHRAAKRMLNALRIAGEPAVYATCDASVPGASEWLHKLGFAPMNETTDTWRAAL